MIIVCRECNERFEITTGEIRFYQKRNFCIPKRCKECRKYAGYRPGMKKNSYFDDGKNCYIRRDVSELREKGYTPDDFMVGSYIGW